MGRRAGKTGTKSGRANMGRGRVRRHAYVSGQAHVPEIYCNAVIAMQSFPEVTVSRGLGEFEQLLLFAVLRLGSNAYGVRMRQEIEAQTGKNVSAGAVYTGLDRLQSRGYLSSWEAESAAGRSGRRRKYYRLEPAGARALEASFQNVRSMAEGTLASLRDLAHADPGADS